MTPKEEVIDALKKVIDPELFIDIWTLGLIYDLEVEDKKAQVKMTFTSMACPAGPYLVDEVKTKIEELPSIDSADVQVVFDPPWQPSDELKAMMGIL
jgi:metal-sulfur cluster biosynthetic enzyme